MVNPVIVRVGFDTRFLDNPAMSCAATSGKPIIFLYIHDTSDSEKNYYGDLQKIRIRRSLEWFSSELNIYKAQLVIRSGNPQDILLEIINETQAEAVYWNRRYTSYHVAQDTQLKQALKEKGISASSFKANLLFEPHEVKNLSGSFYKVYTPFKNACYHIGINLTLVPRVTNLNPYPVRLQSQTLEDIFPYPRNPDWASDILNQWSLTEQGGLDLLKDFLDNGLNNYKEGRNFPAKNHISRLSPYLAQGLISPKTILVMLEQYPDSKDKDHFISEVLWREFSYYLLFHAPYMETSNFRSEWDNFPWKQLDTTEDQKKFSNWTKGQTGIPIIDAAMMELWKTGYMHNRTRMIVASYLVKHMMIHWKYGEAWFKNTLIDYDTANNIAGWQWVAGSGADAAPYFRIFNPVTQAEKFDADCVYIKKYVPQLLEIPNQIIHQSGSEMAQLVQKYGYYKPIVDLDIGRKTALDAYQKKNHLNVNKEIDI